MQTIRWKLCRLKGQSVDMRRTRIVRVDSGHLEFHSYVNILRHLVAFSMCRRIMLTPFIRDTGSCRKEETLPKRWSMLVSDLSDRLQRQSIKWVTRWWLVRLPSTQVKSFDKGCTFFCRPLQRTFSFACIKCFGSLALLRCPRSSIRIPKKAIVVADFSAELVNFAATNPWGLSQRERLFLSA